MSSLEKERVVLQNTTTRDKRKIKDLEDGIDLTIWKFQLIRITKTERDGGSIYSDTS